MHKFVLSIGITTLSISLEFIHSASQWANDMTSWVHMATALLGLYVMYKAARGKKEKNPIED